MVGYDLDGILRSEGPGRSKPFMKQTGEERRAFDDERREHCKVAECLMLPPDDEPYVIITGSPRKFRAETEAWLAEKGFCNFTIEFIDRSRTRQNMIAFKAEKIQQYGVTTFYEDDPKIVRALRRRCPGLEVIYIESSW